MARMLSKTITTVVSPTHENEFRKFLDSNFFKEYSLIHSTHNNTMMIHFLNMSEADAFRKHSYDRVFNKNMVFSSIQRDPDE